MKKINLMLFAFAMLFTLTQCNNTAPDTLISNADTRAKAIADLMNNDTFMKEVMVAMKAKHGNAIVSTSCDMMKEDKAIGAKMMGNMMDMCMADNDMCKMMVTKTMNMLDDKQFDCCTTGKMMMGDEMAMNHDDKGDCCKKGGMAMGKSGKMTAAEKLNCCMMASKK